MSSDVPVVELHGGSAAGPSVRRRHVVVAVVLLIAVAGVALWWTQSSPVLAAGSQVGPTGGAEVVVEQDPFADPGVEVYRQTRPDAWTAWSVRNEGRYTVTLTQAAAANPGPNAMPRHSVRFLAGRADGGSPDGLFGATPTGLLDSVTIAPGEEGFVVGEVYYPPQCLVVGEAAASSGPTYTWVSVSVDARVLGRTSTLVLPLPRRIATPTAEGTCPLEAFGSR